MPGSAAAVLRAFGGSASTADLLSFTTQWAVRSAVAGGEIQRLARGMYALPETPKPRRAAGQLRGVISHESAAAHWLMDPLCAPSAVHVTVGRNSRPLPMKGVVLHYADIDDDYVTSPLRTVLDCALSLPFNEALAIADSALRRELVTPDQLAEAAAGRRGAGRQRIWRVVDHADARADNPFESGLRAISIDAGLTLQPQLIIPSLTPVMRVDLGDLAHRVVFEADSFSYHGTREAFRRDCWRYDELTSYGWLVLRFAWEQVMFEQTWVGDVMVRTMALRSAAVQTRRSQQERRSRAG